jgi:hypothetical protein
VPGSINETEKMSNIARAMATPLLLRTALGVIIGKTKRLGMPKVKNGFLAQYSDELFWIFIGPPYYFFDAAFHNVMK